MEILEVGQRVPIHFSRFEGIRLEFSTMFELHICLPNLSKKEIEGTKSGDIKFGLTEIEDILFLAVEVEDLIDMSDTPFHMGLYKDTSRIQYLPEKVEEGNGLPLHIVLIDTNDSKIKALRLVSLTTEMSNKIIEICNKQIKSSFSNMNYAVQLSVIQESLDSKKIYDMSKIRYEICNS